MTRFLFIAFSLAIFSAQAQFIALPGNQLVTTPGTGIVINSIGNVNLGDNNFDLSNANVVVALRGSATVLTHTHTNARSNALAIDSLRMDGGNSALAGTWVITKGITLKNGKLLVNPGNPTNARLIYVGANDLTPGNDNSYIQGPMFIGGASQNRTYPIGNANGYFPAQLNGVTDANALMRMECFYISGNPPILLSDLTAKYEDIDNLLTDRIWTLNVFNATTYSGSPISLSLNNQSVIDLSKNKPVVIELDSLNTISGDLQGTFADPFVLSEANTSSKGGKYMVATSHDVAIKIHKLITPNGDGENEVLVIEGIDLYPNNKVTLLDRWGGVYLTKEGFSSGQTGIDYTKLVNGNYICTVEYVDSKGATHKPKPQMITVLK